ncbi:hypothetical protein N7495_004929 [Penicillium taxi]|uniref:uncharacterized protein n=1 Tax=Penicillium taxi TaxID=168475 RepID=UPI0025459C14|nr:uncharacterized protein N7495_004929 [Penicillium taxi]KAJ5893238.1 hypothetical protein N7495_004929 [Penicillium taxi]
MVTGRSQPGMEPTPLPTTSDHVGANSPPSKRDLVSWWRQFKRNTTRKEDSKEPPRGIFGVPLNESIKYANVAISLNNENGESFIYGYVPIVVAKCGVFLKEKATDVEGIFRLNGSAKRIKDLQELFDSPERYGKGLDWEGYTVHDAANVLRRYLNQLPEPIVPLEFYERFREPLRVYQRQVQAEGPVPDAERFDHARAVETYQRLIIELPPLNKQLLLYILDLLAVFASKSEQNRMTSANLSAIFQPGLLSHPQHDMSPEEYKLSQDVLIFLIENQDHFLVGMSGSAVDEQTIKEVQAGSQPKVPTLASQQPTGSNRSPTSTVRRSASNASVGNDNNRKLDSLRRNASVSSRNSRGSRASNRVPSPATPNSIGGSGVHRSNTLPSKMGPVVTSVRAARANEASSTTPPVVSVSHSSRSASRSASRPPSLREEAEESISNPKPAAPVAPLTPTGSVFVHTATHGPISPQEAEKLSIVDTRVHENLEPPSSPPPAVVTPTRERKLANIFSKTPSPDAEGKEHRQPNRLRKKRIPGSASISAQSSSISLHGVLSEHAHDTTSDANRELPSTEGSIGDTTPRPPNPEISSATAESTPTFGEGAHHTENTLRPQPSRTPSINSRSSFTDNSDIDGPDDDNISERRSKRRSWRFSRSNVGLGLGSPPLVATNPIAQQSTSSIGSGQHPASRPLSLDAGAHGSSVSSTEPEKRSLFGRFKAKVAHVRDGGKDERERTKSPNQSDSEPSAHIQPLSPTTLGHSHGMPIIDVPSEQPKEEPLRSPSSLLPVAGMPPSIPEEPHSPETPTVPESKIPSDTSAPAANTLPSSDETVTSAPLKESTDESVSTQIV